jgi:putative hydrolase of the HAD superfamily
VTANAQPALAAVLFDYGHTLVDIRWQESTLVDGERIFLEALPAPGVPLEEFHEETVTLLREAEAAVVDHVEVDYPALVRRALARFGVTPEAADLAAAMRVQILSWNSVRHVHPDVYELLDALRARGLRIGYVSNTYDPPEILREVIRNEGMEERADAIVLSSELGFRKPSPRIYQAALREVDAPAAATLFVGDRVLEDVVGPAREGMRTCLATWFRTDDGDHALAGSVAEEPLQVLHVVDGGRGA